MSENNLPTPEPVVDEDSKPFWDATAEGKLLLQRCGGCDAVIWYPKGMCPECQSQDLKHFEASGKGSIYSYTVTHKVANSYGKSVPFVLAYVELEEGPRMMTNIVDYSDDQLNVGQPVEVVFHDTGKGNALPRFKPAG